MSIQIRPYKSTDSEQVEILFNNFQDYLVALDPLHRLTRSKDYEKKYLPNLLRRLKKESGKLFVAVMDKEIIGLVACIIEPLSANDRMGLVPTKSGRVIELYVEKEYRGTGLGKQLMEFVENYLKKQKCDSICLEVFGPNISAHKFYKQMGYTDRDYEMIKLL